MIDGRHMPTIVRVLIFKIVCIIHFSYSRMNYAIDRILTLSYRSYTHLPLKGEAVPYVRRDLPYRFKLIVLPAGSWALRFLPPDVLAVATEPACDCISSL